MLEEPHLPIVMLDNVLFGSWILDQSSPVFKPVTSNMFGFKGRALDPTHRIIDDRMEK